MGLLKTMTLIGIIGVSAVCAASQNETPAPASVADTVPSGLVNLPSNALISDYIFAVDKNSRELLVYQKQGVNLNLVSRFPTDIGKGQGDKVKAGDFKTPEGIYFLQEKRQGREINFDQYGSLAFTTNYPNYFDMKNGKTGYGIWLHAIPDTVPLTRGSRGCVVVRNEVIQNLSSLIELNKTPIIIYDHIEFVPSQDIQSTRKNITSFIDSWKASWESQNMDTYMSHYDNNFTARNMNFEQWKKYKVGLQYSTVKVELSEPVIIKNKDKILIKTYQKYTSDKHTDYGVKTLYAVETASGIKILGEDWEPQREATVGSLNTPAASSTKN